MSFREYVKEKFANNIESNRKWSLVTKLYCQTFITIGLGLSMIFFGTWASIITIGLLIGFFAIFEMGFLMFVYPDYIEWKKRRSQ